MDNLYKYAIDSPYHVSVGAILFNDKNEICVHRFLSKSIPKESLHLTGGLDEVYLLMRETVHDNEPLEMAALRGIEEEFGAIGKVEKYLGALTAKVDDGNSFFFEKVTHYFAIRLKVLSLRNTSDIEGRSELLWLTPEEALGLFKEQARKTKREELNEVEIIKRFINTYESR